MKITVRADYNTIASAGMKALGGVHGYVTTSGLAKSLLDLVYLRVSQINGCAYCIDMHSRDLIKGGMDVEKLVLVPAWHEAEALFDARERAALAWAERVTLIAAGHPTDADYAAFATVFGAKEMADLTIAIGLMNAYNRLGISFRALPEAVRKSSAL